MEGSAEPAPKPRPKKRVLLVLVVAVVVVLAAVVVGWLLLRPWTIGQVLGLSHFQIGSPLTVAGTITAVDRVNTSEGTRVGLELDNNALCRGGGHVWGDPNATYRAGDAFQTTLHFRSLTFNGDPAVSAPELACPFPSAFQAIGAVVDSVSQVAGMTLAYHGSLPGGWSAYDIVPRDGLAYNASVLPVTLRKESPVPVGNPALPAGSPIDSADRWTTVAALEYLSVSGGMSDAPVIDSMPSLASGTSANGSLSFVDANHDRLADLGDQLLVRLPGTASPTAWDTYLLQVGSVLSQGPASYAAAVHYILNGPSGPFEILPSSKPTTVELAYAGDQVGPPRRTAVEAIGVPFGSTPRIDQIDYALSVDNGMAVSGGTLTSLPRTTSTGLTLTFSDATGDGLLDAGDRFVVEGAADRTHLALQFLASGSVVADIEWIAGYGQPYHVGYDVSFAVQGGGPWTLTATVPSWSPELALNRTLRASLWENGLEVVTNASLGSGTIGTFTNGSLVFTDADSDGFLSTGDSFTLHGNPTATYVLRIDILFASWIAPIQV